MKKLSPWAVPAGFVILAAGCRTTYPVGVENFPDAGGEGGVADGTTIVDVRGGDAAAHVDANPKGETGGSPADAPASSTLPDTPVGSDVAIRDSGPDAGAAVLPLSVATGSRHACAVFSDGTVTCWGDNSKGQLGVGSTADKAIWQPVRGLSDAVDVVARVDHSCALLRGGSVKCWGDNSYGQLGNGTKTGSATAVDVSQVTGVTAISAGEAHVCALLKDSTVRCWGANYFGQSGGTASGISTPPVPVANLANVTTISAGSGHTCAIVVGGAIWCWGYNGNGALGDGNNVTPGGSTPRLASRVAGAAVSLSAAWDHTCAVLDDGTATCWGYYGDGLRPIPKQVAGLGRATRITSGDTHMCAVLQDGMAQCWGRGGSGELGRGTPAPSNAATPADVTGLTGVKSISVSATFRSSSPGSRFTCAVADPGKIYCWGWNGAGITGDGSRDFRPAPVDVKEIANAVDIAVGNSSSCALLSDATIKCWGSNAQGNLGDGSTTDPVHPVTVAGLSGVTSLGIRCAAVSSGAVYCWGSNTFCEIGNGCGTRATPRPSPIPAVGISDAVAVSHDYEYQKCAVTAAGTVKCWGGLGTIAGGTGKYQGTDTPRMIEGVANAKAVATSLYHSCALISDGTVKCWGANDQGQLGNGSTTPDTLPLVTPVAVTNLTDVASVTAGAYKFSCALLTQGTVKCWGNNENGQLGNGGTAPSSVPITVNGVSNATSISSSGAAGGMTCAVLADGSVTCWGMSLVDERARFPPIPMPGLSGVKKVAISDGRFACALLTNGGAKCWGSNQYGALGDGSIFRIFSPVEVAGL